MYTVTGKKGPTALWASLWQI